MYITMNGFHERFEILYYIPYIEKKYLMSICIVVPFRNHVILMVLCCYILSSCWANVCCVVDRVMCGFEIYHETLVEILGNS